MLARCVVAFPKLFLFGSPLPTVQTPPPLYNFIAHILSDSSYLLQSRPVAALPLFHCPLSSHRHPSPLTALHA